MEKLRTSAPGIALAAILAVGLAACGSSGGSSSGSGGSSGGTVKVGFLWSLTGAFSPYGKPVQDGINLAVKRLNDAGGFLVAGKRYRMAIDTVDDRSDQASSVAGAQQIIRDDGDKVLLGPIGPLAPAVAKVAAAQKGVQITTSSSADLLAGTPSYPMMFAALPAVSIRVSTALQSIKRFEPQVHTIAMVAPNDETSQELAPVLTKAFTGAGYRVSQFLFPASTTDLSVTMTKVAAAKPDLIFLGWSAADFANELPALNPAGIPKTTPMFVYSGDSTLEPQMGGRPYIADPLSSADFTAPHPTPQARSYAQKLVAFLGTTKLPPFATTSQYFYDIVALVASAMSKAGTTTDAAAIAAALKQVTVTGVSGDPTGFNSHNALSEGLDYTFFKDGKSTTVHFG